MEVLQLESFGNSDIQSYTSASIPIWEWCWMVSVTVSAFAHILVLIAILRARHSNCYTILKTPFFTIIFIQGIHEILELCTTMGFNRLRKYRIIKYPIVVDNKLVEWQWHWYNFLKGTLYFGHLEMALNRLSAVVFTQYNRYNEIWSNRNIILINISGYIITAGLRLVIYTTFFSDMVVTTTLEDDLLTFTETGLAPAFENAVDIVLSLSTATICIFCYSMTAVLQRKRAYINPRTRRRELILLKTGLVTFLILLPMTSRSGLELWALLCNRQEFHSFMVRWNTLSPEAMCIAQPWLLLISLRSLRQSMFCQAKVSHVFSTVKNTIR